MTISATMSFYRSSVAQKLLVAVTGVFLCVFLIVHLTGNLLLFKNDGGKAFENYAEFMATNVGIRTMELVLASGFLFHIIWGFRMWLSNRGARPVKYAVNRANENSDLTSRIMFVTGSVVFLFLVIHLKTFFVPSRFPGDDKVSMFELVRSAFSSPLYVVFYLVALFLLGFHLRHGFQSAFQTFGLRPGWRRPIEAVSILFWLVIPIGFATMPLYFLWTHLQGH